MDRFGLMTVFVRVAETGNFTRAAESLAVSRATVSVSVRQLEELLGARLLHRTTRRVSLTGEGQLYYERAREVLAKLEASEQLFQNSRPKVTGRLSIDVPTRIARRVLIPALSDFLARHPGLDVQLGASDRNIDLVEKGVDAVVRVGPLRDSSHIARALGSLVQINCASPRYLARYGEPKTPADLDQHLVVAYGSDPTSSHFWDYVEHGKLTSRPVRSTVSVDNAETYVAACLADLGLIQIPAYDVRHHLESGALVAILPRHVAPALPISLVYPSRRQLPARLRAFSEWIVTLFARHGMLDTPTPAAIV